MNPAWLADMTLMERREEVRFPAHVPVEFSILGPDPQVLTGYIRDVSEGGLRMTVEAALKAGDFVLIRVDDSEFYGEVKYCCPWMGGYLTGLLVERALVGDSDLSRLIAATLQPASQAAPAPDGTALR